jgi:hypothetical protein
LICGPLSVANSLLTAWTAITTGSFKVTVDGGSLQSLTGLNFSGATTFPGIATIINGVLTGAICSYNAVFNRFEFKSNTTGATSTVSFLTAGTGVDISGMLNGLVNSSAYVANGIVAETALAAATLFDSTFGQQWYALSFASSVMPVNADNQAVAGFIEATTTYHYFAVSSQDTNILVASSTTDIAYLLSQTKYKRTAVQYSSSTPYAAVSLLGRILTTNYAGNNTVITLMWKQEPSITAENLNSTQIAGLEGKNANVFVAYNNNTAIIEPGASTSGDFIDTIIGAAAFAVTMQTALYNVLFQSPTKIPQTDAGTHILVTAIETVCTQFVNDGLLAPGVWNSAGFGVINQGDFLSKGYYVFAPSITSQTQAARAARISVPIQVAAKLAGAVHTVNLAITVNA